MSSYVINSKKVFPTNIFYRQDMGISSKFWADIFMVITCIYGIVVTFILFGLEIISLHIVFFTYTFLNAWLTTRMYRKYICLWISALVSVTFKHYKDILDITTILLSNHKIFVTMFYQKYVSSMSPLTANSTQGIFFSFFLLPFLQLIGLGVTLNARW